MCGGGEGGRQTDRQTVSALVFTPVQLSGTVISGRSPTDRQTDIHRERMN